MGVRWWMFLMSVFISLTILGGIFDEQVTNLDDADTDLSAVLQLRILRFTNINLGFARFDAPIPNTQFFGSLAALAVWDFNFFSGDLNIVRWVVWLPLTAGLFFTAVLQVGPVILQAAGIARNILRL